MSNLAFGEAMDEELPVNRYNRQAGVTINNQIINGFTQYITGLGYRFVVVIRDLINEEDIKTIANNLLEIKTVPKFKCSNYRRCVDVEAINPIDTVGGNRNPTRGDQYGFVQFNHSTEKEMVRAVAGVPKWVGFEFIPGNLYNQQCGNKPGCPNRFHPDRKLERTDSQEDGFGQYDYLASRTYKLPKQLAHDNDTNPDNIKGVYRPCLTKRSYRNNHNEAVAYFSAPPYVCMKDGYRLDIEDFNSYLDKQRQTISLIETNIDKALNGMYEALISYSKNTAKLDRTMYTLIEEFVLINQSYFIGAIFQLIISEMKKTIPISGLDLNIFDGPDKLMMSSVGGSGQSVIPRNHTIENMFRIQKALYKMFAIFTLANGITNLTDKNDPAYYYRHYSGRVNVPKPVVNISEINDIMNKIDEATDNIAPNGSIVGAGTRLQKWKNFPDMSKHLTLFSDHSYRDIWEIFNDVPVYKNVVEFGNRNSFKRIGAGNTDITIIKLKETLSSFGTFNFDTIATDINTLNTFMQSAQTSIDNFGSDIFELKNNVGSAVSSIGALTGRVNNLNTIKTQVESLESFATGTETVFNKINSDIAEVNQKLIAISRL